MQGSNGDQQGHPSVTSWDDSPVASSQFLVLLHCGFVKCRLVVWGFFNGKRKPQTLAEEQPANPRGDGEPVVHSCIC